MYKERPGGGCGATAVMKVLSFLALASVWSETDGKKPARETKLCLGIDLGSEVGRAAVSAQYGRGSRIVLNSLSGRTFPQIVGWRRSEEDGGNERVISEGAKHQQEGRPSSTVQRARAAVVRDPQQSLNISFMGGSAQTTPLEVLATLIEHIYEAAGGRDVERSVTIAVPSFMSSEDRQVVSVAAEAAGLTPPRIVNEHFALAVAYANVHDWQAGEKNTKKRTSLTMFVSTSAMSVQATVVRYALQKAPAPPGGSTQRPAMQKTATVVSHAHTARSGAKFVQLRTLEHILAQLLQNTTLCTASTCDPIETMRHAALSELTSLSNNSVSNASITSTSDRSMARALHLTKRLCEELTSVKEAEIRLDNVFDGVTGVVSYTLTRSDFEKINVELEQAVTAVMREAAQLYDAGFSDDSKPMLSKRSRRLTVPGGVELYGGGARMPFVQNAVTALLGPHSAPIFHRLDKDEAAALAASVVSANVSYPDPSAPRVTDILTQRYLLEVYALKKSKEKSKKSNKSIGDHERLHDTPIFAKYIGGGGVMTNETLLFNESYAICEEDKCVRGPERPPGILHSEAKGKKKYPQTKSGGGSNVLPIRFDIPVLANMRAAMKKNVLPIDSLDALLVVVTAVSNDAMDNSSSEHVEAAFIATDIPSVLKDAISDGTKQGLRSGPGPSLKNQERKTDPLADPLEILARITVSQEGTVDLARVKLSQLMHKTVTIKAKKKKKKGESRGDESKGGQKVVTERMEKRVPVNPFGLGFFEVRRSGVASDVDIDHVREKNRRMNLADETRHELASARNDLEGLLYEALEVLPTQQEQHTPESQSLQEETTALQKFLESGRHPLTEYHLHRVKLEKLLLTVEATSGSKEEEDEEEVEGEDKSDGKGEECEEVEKAEEAGVEGDGDEGVVAGEEEGEEGAAVDREVVAALGEGAEQRYEVVERDEGGKKHIALFRFWSEVIVDKTRQLYPPTDRDNLIKGNKTYFR